MSNMTKNDLAWQVLFDERKILDDINAVGVHHITSADINVKREARLMTKFDHRINLPDIFEKHELAILPNSRGSYIIGRFECYESFESDKRESPIEWGFPDWMRSLAPDNLYSESAALLCAYHAGLIKDVLDEEVSLTVFGRMSTGTFDFNIEARDVSGPVMREITVDRAQLEIDGGFESVETFAVFEVKNEDINDFHIRQLYYPYRLWSNKLNKKVSPVFMTYSNEVFTLSTYEFEIPENYNSLKLNKRKRYQIVPTEIGVSDIRAALSQTQSLPEPEDIPFPQADSMERVIDLLVQLYVADGSLEQEEITTNYAFNVRQTQYYSNAARYLGLLESDRSTERGVYYLMTPLGTKVMMQAPRARNLELIKIILSHRVFRDAVKFYLSNARPPQTDKIVEMMEKARLSLNGTTRHRRAQTVTSWVKWIFELTAEA